MSEVFHNGIVAAIATYAAVNIGRILWPGNDSSLGLKNWFHFQNVDIKYWKNKVCFITGASSGIGEALAILIAKSGGTVIACARRKEKLNKIANMVKDCDGKIIPHKLDVTNISEDDFKTFLQLNIISKFGKLDICVLNAGRGALGLAENLNMDNVKSLYELNVFSVIMQTKALIPILKKQSNKANIVITSSLVGVLPNPGETLYTSSKHAIHGFFNALRPEVSEFANVLLVCPGPVSTEFGENRISGAADGTEKGRKKSIYVSAERCAQLYAIAIQEIESKGHTEVWLAKNPFLLFAYLARYTPHLFAYVFKSVAKGMLPKE